MKAIRGILGGLTALIAAAGVIQACGSDGDKTDGGTDASKAEAGKDVHPSGEAGPEDGGGDSGCGAGKSLCGTSCVDERTDSKNCGGCGLTCSVACVKGECVETLAKSGGPSYVALDTKNVYWTSTGSCTGDGGAAISTGAVMAMPLTGGTPVTLAMGQPRPEGIATDGTNVYWANNAGSDCAASGGAVLSVSPDGGAVTTIASSQASAKFVALDTKNVYWTTSDGVLTAPLGGVADGGAPVALATGQGDSAGLAVIGAKAYWAQHGGKGNVLSVSVGGGALATLTTTKTACPAGCIGFTADAKHVYYAFVQAMEYPNCTVMSLPLGGGSPSTLSTEEGQPANMASDGVNLYWTNYGKDEAVIDANNVVKAPPTGGSGTPIVIATNQNQPQGIAVNGTSVYWANNGNPGGGIERATPK